ncbi:MAG TPA: hypothetical protein VI032_00620 [Burkholderiaceae bacterium]
MSFMSLSQAYRIAPRAREVVRTPSLQATAPAGERDRRSGRDGAPGDERRRDGEPDIDSVRRSPLLRALLRSLQLPQAASGAADAVLEQALIGFARALNLATGDVDTVAQPMPARADDAAQRRARNEELLLAAFAELQHAAGRAGAPTHEALQERLGAFLHALARELRVDDDRTGEATHPGSLISVLA